MLLAIVVAQSQTPTPEVVTTTRINLTLEQSRVIKEITLSVED